MIFFGDSFSRKFAYWIRFRPAQQGQASVIAMFLCTGFLGLALLKLQLGLFATVAGASVFFMNGVIY